MWKKKCKIQNQIIKQNANKRQRMGHVSVCMCKNQNWTNKRRRITETKTVHKQPTPFLSDHLDTTAWKMSKRISHTIPYRNECWNTAKERTNETNRISTKHLVVPTCEFSYWQTHTFGPFSRSFVFFFFSFVHYLFICLKRKKSMEMRGNPPIYRCRCRCRHRRCCFCCCVDCIKLNVYGQHSCVSFNKCGLWESDMLKTTTLRE